MEKNLEEQIAINGESMQAEVTLNYDSGEERFHTSPGERSFDQLRSVIFDLTSSTRARAQVRGHRATREAESVALPVRVTLQSNGEAINCELTNRQAVLPIPVRNGRLEIAFERQMPERESILDQL